MGSFSQVALSAGVPCSPASSGFVASNYLSYELLHLGGFLNLNAATSPVLLLLTILFLL